ncbi:MAG: sensor domain-containing diguanylate cyclase [Deltaproteobacteria bacterium]|nr:sensor domain-containing diguanylate cyclase [Deltaproteobacteria bacterium]
MILVSLLAAEFLVMVAVLPHLVRLDPLVEGIVDALLVSVVISPVLYFALVRPLERQLDGQAAAEREISAANLRLAAAVRALEERSAETAVLAEMDDLLQSSRSLPEAYQVVARAGERLFRDASGGVLVLANSRNVSELSARWGAAAPPCAAERCTPEECWALRRGQLHLVSGEGLGVPCAAGDSSRPHACAPMVAQGEALGVVTVDTGPDATTASQREKLVTFTRHLALSLANLRLHETLHRQSVSDPLTGLFNRRYLQVTMEREMARARRRQAPVSLLILDVDHFKRFNDDFGHETGDLVLQEVARLLKRGTRAEDIVCRYGGEEFVVVMPEASLAVGAERAENLRAQVEQLRIAPRGETLRAATISLGVACFPEHGEEIADLLKVADAALYRSKAGGRNRVTVAPAGAAPAVVPAA